jgi:cytoskeletal protein RodZ
VPGVVYPVRMSSFRHPVGPQKPGVYWRRRATVAGVILLIVVVIVLIVVGRGNGASSAAAPSASPSSSPAASSSSSSASASSPSASASASAPASAADGSTCSKDQITLKPVLDKSAYGPTEDPKIAMSIENTGSNSCHMDLGSSQQVLTISSGEEQYWSSKDCQTGGTNQDVTIKAGQTLTTPAIAWDRTRSSTSTCDASRPSVTGGGASYHLQVAVGNITSKDSAQFILN